MSNINSHARGNSVNQNADDFRLINGLPKTAKTKLHAAGILTFAQLAAMSPPEIVAALGESNETTAERIIREDWAGQAGRLAAPCEKILEKIAEAPAPPVIEVGERRTSFAPELKLNEDKTVRQTRVMHVECEEKDAEETWKGWDETRLLDFIVCCGKLALSPRVEVEEAYSVANAENSVEERLKRLHAISEETETIRNFPSSTQSAEDSAAAAAGVLPKGLEAFAGETGAPFGLARSGEAYNFSVVLDSAELQSLAAGKLAYTVTVYAKSVDSACQTKRHLVAGETQGVIAAANKLVFIIKGAKLTPGAYRLHATACFNALGNETVPRPQIMTFVEGGVFQVY